MARKRRFRLLAHRLGRAPSVGGAGLGCQPVRFALAARFRRAQARYSVTAYRLIQKARDGFSGAGLILTMMKICQ
jgi:hypothetical protein